MNKQELKSEIATRTGLTQKQAGDFLDALTAVIVEQVSAGQKVSIMGFGGFEARLRQARNGRNPSTGEAIQIPAKHYPAFSAGKDFEEAVHKGHTQESA